MKTSGRQPRDLFDGPSVYRIEVLGRLTDDLTSRIPNLTLEVIDHEGESAVTILHAEMRDQSALAGFLEILYEMHAPIISAELLDSASAAKPE